MNTKEIIESLTGLFSKPHKDGENRKIIYWIDVDRSFLENFDEINIDGVKKSILKENNYFYTKYLLEEEDIDSDFLIYTNEDLDQVGDNWLIDNQLYSTKFYADEVSIILRSFGIPEELRPIVSGYKTFFRSQERENRFRSLNIERFTEESLEIGMISTLTNQKTSNFEDSLRTILMESLDDENNKYIEKIRKSFSIDIFWTIIEKYYGYKSSNRTIKGLLIHLMITTLSHSINADKLSIYNNFIATHGKSNCLIFVDKWMNHKSDYLIYDKYAKTIEKEINFSKILSSVNIDEFKNAEIFPSIDRAIILYITNSIGEKLDDIEEYLKLIRLRKSKHFYEKFKEIYDSLYNLVKMYEFRKIYPSDLPLEKSNIMMESYVNKYYLMDSYYRKFYVSYDNSDGNDLMKKLKSMVEDIYTNWFMVELSHNWTKSLSLDKSDIFEIQGFKKQEDFYTEFIRPKIDNGERVFVIISDALRFDVAAEICDRLDIESLGSSNLGVMVSGLPTITKFGMARLLPHKTIGLKDNGTVEVDGISSGGIEGRNNILNNLTPESSAIDYDDIVSLSKNELRDYAKGKKLFYIYHDSIDAIGDKAASEAYVFGGCEKAIDEISNLVKIIRDRLSGVNIYITTDHGFIYQREKLEEVDKLSKEKIDFIESKRRYILTHETKDIDGMLRYSIKDINSEVGNINVYTPNANIRLKTQGAGANFVHGGASLQEVVIPIIEYKNIRYGQSNAKSVEKTKIKLTNTVYKITNSIFTLNFFQTEKVEGKIISTSVSVYFVDDMDNEISNRETLLGDKTTDNPQERNLSIRFVLKSMNYDSNKNYYLIIKDSGTGVIYDKIPFVISLGIISDFDF